MRRAWEAYQRALAAGRQHLGRPDLPDLEAAERLLALEEPAFRSYAQRLGLSSPKHLRYTVLAVARYPRPLQEVLRRGGSFAQAERLLRRLERGEVDLEGLERAAADGTWPQLLAAAPPGARWAGKPVWVFPADRKARRAEGLNPLVAQLLVERYSRPGDLVVDPMAGQGTVVRAALGAGRRAWGSDLAGDGRLVRRLDVRDLARHLPPGQADLLVLHPPTYRWFWRHEHAVRPEAYPEHPYDEYTNWLSRLVEHTLPVLRPGGRAVLVARPEHRPHPRWAGRAHPPRWPFVAPLENLLAEHDLAPLAYHLAVADDGEEDWSIFVGEKPDP